MKLAQIGKRRRVLCCSAAAPALQQESVDSVAGQLQDMQVSATSTGDHEEVPVTKAEPVGNVRYF